MSGRRPLLRGLLGAGALLGLGAWNRSAQAQARTQTQTQTQTPAPVQAPSPAATATGAEGPSRVLVPRTLRFPRDHGSHPDLRTEWWYLTGQAAAGERRWGFQVTFFRSRVDASRGMTSAFAARELLFAHAAVTDLATGRLHHDQRIARAGFGVAQAGLADTDLRIRDWTLLRQADGRYRTRIEGGDFALALEAAPTQPLLLQGQDGLSRKGPEPAQASYYYSQPQLQVQGQLRLGRQAAAVAGRAWLDHEWSEALLHPEAVGWDWVGMNLADGSALTAFQLRRADGSALWAGGSWRTANGTVQAFGPQAVRMVPTRHWSSPLTGTRYPVAWSVTIPQGRFQVEALADAQELDSRRSTGTVYWEGLSELRDATGRAVGQGYLELTGYGDRLRL